MRYFQVPVGTTERPKGMRKTEWALFESNRDRLMAPQHYIVWLHRGFPIQWCRSPDFDTGPMNGIEYDFPFMGGLPLETWHAALVDAMHWAYDPRNDPPTGWRIATKDELLNMGPSTQESESDD